MDQYEALLAALREDAELRSSAELPPERVLALGEAWLGDEALARAVDELAAPDRGALRLDWGGKVTVLQPPAAAAGGAAAPSAGRDLYYVVGSPNATVGRDNVGAGVRVGVSGEVLAKLVGSLAAAQAQLRELGPALGDEAAVKAQAAASAAGEVAAELAKPEPNKPAVERQLKRAVEAAEDLGKLAGAAEKLAPALGLLRGAFGLARTYLGV